MRSLGISGSLIAVPETDPVIQSQTMSSPRGLGRLQLTRRGLAAAALAALFGLASGCEPAPAVRGVIVICLDTLRLDRAQFAGSSRRTTPFLADFSRRGTTFLNAQSTSNWTVPAVASVFTGLRPARHGAVAPGEVKNLGFEPRDPNQIAPGISTLAEAFARAGFRTGLFSGNPYLYGRFKDGFDVASVGRGLGREQVDNIVRFLDDSESAPFLLYWQVMDLHQPLEPPVELERRFARSPSADFPNALHRNWAFHDLDFERSHSAEFIEYRELRLALYDAALRHVDDLIRSLIVEIERRGLLSSTLIVLTSDHGEEFWDHALEPPLPARDPRGFRGIGHGHTMFQELLRVPLVFVGPGARARTTVICPVSLADLHPTLLAAAALTVPKDLDGEDLGSMLRSPLQSCAPRAILSESPAYGPDSWAVRAGRWKIVARVGEEPLLFDLRDDPNELHPGRGIPREVERRLRRLLADRIASPIPSSPASESAPSEEELRALGYLR